jgi:hypothetical protein
MTSEHEDKTAEDSVLNSLVVETSANETDLAATLPEELEHTITPSSARSTTSGSVSSHANWSEAQIPVVFSFLFGPPVLLSYLNPLFLLWSLFRRYQHVHTRSCCPAVTSRTTCRFGVTTGNSAFEPSFRDSHDEYILEDNGPVE